MKMTIRLAILGISLGLLSGCEPATYGLAGIRLGEPFADVQARFGSARVRAWDEAGCECWRIDRQPPDPPYMNPWVQVRDGRVFSVIQIRILRHPDEATSRIEEIRRRYRVLQELPCHEAPCAGLLCEIAGENVFIGMGTSRSEVTGEFLFDETWSFLTPPSAGLRHPRAASTRRQ